MDNFQLEIIALHKAIGELRMEVSHLQQETGTNTIIECFKKIHSFRVAANPNLDNTWIVQIYNGKQGHQENAEPIYTVSVCWRPIHKDWVTSTPALAPDDLAYYNYVVKQAAIDQVKDQVQDN